MKCSFFTMNYYVINEISFGCSFCLFPLVSRNVFRDRYITPLEDDELDQHFELNELYDDELTPAPNQVDDSSSGQISHKYSDEPEATVKAENILTQSKDGKS